MQEYTDTEILDWIETHHAEIRCTVNNGLYWINWRDGNNYKQTLLSYSIINARSALIEAMNNNFIEMDKPYHTPAVVPGALLVGSTRYRGRRYTSISIKFTRKTIGSIMASRADIDRFVNWISNHLYNALEDE